MFARHETLPRSYRCSRGVHACVHRSTPASSYPPYETVISGGKIVDGTGNAWFYGDVGIVGDHIARIAPAGMLAKATAQRRIDARGLVVAPGVIDIQAHSEEQLLYGDSRVMGMITQGVTTMIMGEGETPGQVSQTMFNDYLKSGDTTQAALFRSFIGPKGFGEWLHAMERHTASVNFGSFIGAGGIRQYAKNMTQGAPTPAELDTMRTVVRQAMRDGARSASRARSSARRATTPGRKSSSRKRRQWRRTAASTSRTCAPRATASSRPWTKRCASAARVAFPSRSITSRRPG
jgi:dihydroorotase/N-acyl-D-amino-acid deacylase